MSSVLYVAGQPDVPDSLALLNHVVTRATTLDEALRHAGAVDAAIVAGHTDLGWARTVTASIRKVHDKLPILLLLKPSGLSIVGADWGFTDFALADVEAAELALRLRLMLIDAQDDPLLAAGPVLIDEAAYAVTVAGEPLDLTYTEFELLRHLVHNDSRVMSRETLLSQVWGYDYYGGTRTVDVHVRRLRAKLGQYDYVIATVRNVGYRFSSKREASA